MALDQAIFALYAGLILFLSTGFSLFLYLGYRIAPIQQNRLLLMIGVAIAASALAEFLGVYGILNPIEHLIFGGGTPLSFLIKQTAMIVASIILFWYSYTTYYFIVKSLPEKSKPKESG